MFKQNCKYSYDFAVILYTTAVRGLLSLTIRWL